MISFAKPEFLQMFVVPEEQFPNLPKFRGDGSNSRNKIEIIKEVPENIEGCNSARQIKEDGEDAKSGNSRSSSDNEN